MPNILDDLGVYFVSLASSHEILTNFGATNFTVNSNLFYIIEPETPTNSVTLIPYSGKPLDTRHKQAQYPSLQIRVRTDGVAKSYKTAKSIINDLHQNPSLGSNIPMVCFSQQTEPMFLKFDAEDYPIFIANFDLMHVKKAVS